MYTIQKRYYKLKVYKHYKIYIIFGDCFDVDHQKHRTRHYKIRKTKLKMSMSQDQRYDSEQHESNVY